jgi:chromosome partitioning protein
MIITIGGIKGGTGKSTISTNLSAYLAYNGSDVILVDANPGQLTSSNWSSRRDESMPIVHCVEKSGDLRRTLKDLNKRYKEVIVDCGGWDSKEFRTSLLISDLLITPIRPSQADIETLPNLSEIVDQASEINEDLDGIVVITQAPSHPTVNLIKNAQEALTELQGFKVSTNIIYMRKPYIDALAKGLGVIDIKNTNTKKAKQEIEELAKEVYNNG